MWISSGVVQDYFEQNSTGSIMPNLNTKILKGLPVILPDPAKQQKIANALRICDTKIAAMERESALLEELFRTALEELMTGQIRLDN